MSAPDDFSIRCCTLDIAEICAARGRAPELAAAMRERGIGLPEIGRIAVGADRFVLCIRPARWLVMSAHDPSGARADAAAAAPWRHAGDALGASIDLSGAHTAFLLQGARSVEVLSRGCRLDLDPRVFSTGSAAATIIGQVQVLLAALPAGILVFAPSSLARHFRDALELAARPSNFVPQSMISLGGLLDENNS